MYLINYNSLDRSDKNKSSLFFLYIDIIITKKNFPSFGQFFLVWVVSHENDRNNWLNRSQCHSEKS